MPSMKEVFEGAKALEVKDPSLDTDVSEKTEEKTKEDVTALLEAQIAEVRAEADKAKREAESYKTEALRIRQDLSENVKLTQSILNKQKSEEQQPDYTDEELAEMLVDNPAKYHKVMKATMKKTVDSVAKQYVADFERTQTKMSAQNQKTSTEIAKMKLAEKYDGLDEDWDDLVAFGDKYPQYTANVHEPKHLEGFYLMYKGTKGEIPKKKDGKAVSEALLKKMAGGLNSGLPTDSGEKSELSTDEKRIASMYNMSVEEYNRYKNPLFNINDHMALKKKARK